MIFIVRTRGATAVPGEARIVHTRPHPSGDARDLFCVGNEREVERLAELGCTIVTLHDGWYPDDLGGGVVVWGNGRYWEVRSSPFDVVAAG